MDVIVLCKLLCKPVVVYLSILLHGVISMSCDKNQFEIYLGREWDFLA